MALSRIFIQILDEERFESPWTLNRIEKLRPRRQRQMMGHSWLPTRVGDE